MAGKPQDVAQPAQRWTPGSTLGLAGIGVVLVAATVAILFFLLAPYGVPLRRLLALAIAPAALAGALAAAAWAVVRTYRRRLSRDREELVALHRGARDIYDELALDHVLQTVIERALPLVEGRYGALSVIEESGRIRAFVTAGISAEERARIGDPPHGRGLLGVPLREGQSLRIPHIGADERSVGFPANHPPMRTLLAVPVICKTPFLGNLYVAEKVGGRTFSAEDEETLNRFALTAALAIDVAYSHRRLTGLAVAEERVRIAREMHDGVAQVLAYVNTKAQAVGEFLRRGRTEEAIEHLEQLAEAARGVSIEVREGILALRSELAGERDLTAVLADYVASWNQQGGVEVELHTDPDLGFPATVELQLVRIVQEALTNVRKHADARHAWVVVRRAGTGALVEVRDDGRGFDPTSRGPGELPRFGLAMMRERAEAIGATIDWSSLPGEGTRVRMEVPSAAAAGEARLS